MLRIDSIVKSFNGSKILDNITFQVNNNETVGLLGPNGAGKTTLMKTICGLIIPDKGNISLDNKILKNEDINVAFEGDRHLYWPISCKENIYYFSALKGIYKNEVDKKLQETIYGKAIESYLDKDYGILSLGQKQLVSIITSLLVEPKILILDEPSNGLDIYYTDQLIDILKLYKEQTKKTILISSHDLGFLSKISDRYIIMNKGKLIKEIDKNKYSTIELEKIYKDALGEKNE